MSEYHDYKEMYLTMVRAAEKAINILAEAQQKGEELYLSGTKPDIKLLDFKKEPPSERHVSAD